MRIPDRQHVLSFAGGHVDLGNHAAFRLTTALTVAAWVKPATGDDVQATILSKDSTAYEPQIQNGVFIFERGAESPGTTTIPTGQWVHLAVTFDAAAEGGHVRLYVNGDLDAAHNYPTPLDVTQHHLLVGKRPGWDGGLFHGQMAGLALWNVARTAWQIKQDVNSTVLPGTPGLVAYWRMDEGMGDTLADSSGNDHTGAFKGAVEWVPLESPIVVNPPSRAPARNTYIGRLHDLQQTAPEQAAAQPLPLPPSGRNGEAQKFLDRVRLHNRQRVHDTVLQTNAAVKQAKDEKAAKLADAHAEATRRLNSTRFDHLYFIRDTQIFTMDAQHRIDEFVVDAGASSSGPAPKFPDPAYGMRPVLAQSNDEWAHTLFGAPGWTMDPAREGRLDPASGGVHSIDESGLLTVIARGSTAAVSGVSYVCVGGPGAGDVDVAVYPPSTNGATQYQGWNGSTFVNGPATPVGGYYWYRLALTWAEPFTDPGAVFYAKTYRAARGAARPFVVWAYHGSGFGQADELKEHATDLAIDQVRKKIFWAQSAVPFSLHAADLDGGNHRVLVRDPGRPITGVAVDTDDQRVFYVAGTGVIGSVGYDGSAPTQVLDISGPARDQRWRIEVDNDNHQIYWTNDFSIWTAGRDGSNARMVVAPEDAPHPIDLAVDGESGRLYWVDKELGVVRAAGLDGSGAHDLYPVDHPLPGLALDEVVAGEGLTQEVYWAAWEDRITAATPGIVGHWRLDDGDGLEAANSAGTGPPLALGGVARVEDDLPPVLSPPRHSLRFDGLRDHLRLPDHAAERITGGSFSIEVWVKPAEVTTGDMPILATADHSLVLMISGRNARVASYVPGDEGRLAQSGGIRSKAQLRGGEWAHVAFVEEIDGGLRTRSVYVNGELEARVGPGRITTTVAPGTAVELGLWTGKHYGGLLAGLHVTSRALTPAEIAANHAAHPHGDVLEALPTGPGWTSHDLPPLVRPPAAVLEFNGYDAYAKVGTAKELGLTGGSFTVECWLAAAELTSGDHAILGTDPCCAAGKVLHLILRDGRPHLGFFADDLTAPDKLDAGRWHHVAWRFDAATKQQAIFVDGTRVASRRAQKAFLGEAELVVGRWAGGGARYFNGLLSDLRIWNVARTDAEIAANHTNYRETFVMRGPVDGSAPPEHLFEATTEGSLTLVSKNSAAHEERLIAARKRKDAQARAARDVAAAHSSYETRVAAKHQELQKTHTESAARIDAKKAEHESDRAANRTKLAQGQSAATRRVGNAKQEAANRRRRANDQAASREASARSTAAAKKNRAKADRDAARRERSKY